MPARRFWPGLAIVAFGAAFAFPVFTALALQWTGNEGQDYKLNITIKDAAGKILKTNAPATITHNGLSYSASVHIPPGNKIDWSVQSISKVHNRVFYSYPLQGNKNFTMPVCNNASTAKTATANKNMPPVKMQATLYPNPVKELLNIQLIATGSDEKNIMVFDVYGRSILTKRSNQNSVQLNVAQLTAGTYFVKITDATGRQVFSSKFIKL